MTTSPHRLLAGVAALRGRPSAVERAAYVAVLAAFDAGNMRGGPQKIAAAEFAGDRSVEYLVRTTVNPLMTTGVGAALAPDIVGDFLGSLAEESAFARLAALAVNVNLSGIDTITFPRRAGAALPGADIAPVEQGEPIPALTETTFDGVVFGPERKLAAFVTVTNELVRYSDNAVVGIGACLKENAGASVDALTLNSDAATPDVWPAGLLAGVSAITASAATGKNDALIEDLENLAGAVVDAGSSGANLVYIASARQAASANIRLRNMPGQQRLTIFPTRALAEGSIVCIDPRALLVSFGLPQIVAGDQAVMVSNTVAANLGTSGVVGSPARSNFQTDMTSLRLIWPMAFVLRAPMILLISDTSWGRTPT